MSAVSANSNSALTAKPWGQSDTAARSEAPAGWTRGGWKQPCLQPWL